MFEKRFNISDINNCFLFESGTLLVQRDGIIERLGINPFKVLGISVKEFDEFQSLCLKGDSLCGIGDERIVFFNKELIQVDEVEVEVIDERIFNDHYVLSQIEFDTQAIMGKYALFDLDKRNSVWVTDFCKALYSVNADDYLSVFTNAIELLNPIDGTKEWSYEITQDTKKQFPQLIGGTGDLAIFGIESLDKLIALDLKTGELKWEISTIVKGLEVDIDKGIIHHMMVNYGAYDLETGELKNNFKDSEFFQSVGIESQRSNYVIVGDHIITTDYCKGVIGAFNTVTHKFDWVHHEEGVSFPAGSPIRYNDSYLFVHDNKGSLHVFERR